MKSYSSREVIQLLKADGWFEVNVVGSHHQFKHPTKKGRVPVKHPDKDIPVKPSPALITYLDIQISDLIPRIELSRD